MAILYAVAFFGCIKGHKKEKKRKKNCLCYAKQDQTIQAKSSVNAESPHRRSNRSAVTTKKSEERTQERVSLLNNVSTWSEQESSSAEMGESGCQRACRVTKLVLWPACNLCAVYFFECKQTPYIFTSRVS